MNLVVLVGRLAQDPTLRTTQNGTSMCTFSIAVDRRYKNPNQPDVDFIDTIAWGKTAEVISQYLTKGRQIAIQGRIQNSQYQAQDGSKRTRTQVVIESFDFIGSRNQNGGQGYNNYNQSSYQNDNYSQYGGGGYNSNHNDYNQDHGNYNQEQSTTQAPIEIDDDFSLLNDDESIPF